MTAYQVPSSTTSVNYGVHGFADDLTFALEVEGRQNLDGELITRDNLTIVDGGNSLLYVDKNELDNVDYNGNEVFLFSNNEPLQDGSTILARGTNGAEGREFVSQGRDILTGAPITKVSGGTFDVDRNTSVNTVTLNVYDINDTDNKVPFVLVDIDYLLEGGRLNNQEGVTIVYGNTELEISTLIQYEFIDTYVEPFSGQTINALGFEANFADFVAANVEVTI